MADTIPDLDTRLLAADCARPIHLRWQFRADLLAITVHARQHT